MAIFLNIEDFTANYRTTLDGEDISIRLYYVRSVDRWYMDVTNLRLDRTVEGIVVNTSTDLLHGAGRLGLQALVAISMPEPLHEASLENFPGFIRLVYLTYEELNTMKFSGDAPIRNRWVE